MAEIAMPAEVGSKNSWDSSISSRDRNLKEVAGMARKYRIRFHGAIYHVTMRGVRKNTIFIDDVDRRKFLRLLAATVDRYGCLCFAYCLMSNHFHLIIQTPRANISRSMQYLDSQYAKFFNWRHRHRGHAYESRFDSPVIEDGNYLASAIAYVARNPVEALLVKDASHWKWSSYRATMGECACPKFLTVDWLSRVFQADTIAASRRLLSLAVHKHDLDTNLDAGIRGGTEFKQAIKKVINATLYRAQLPRSLRAIAQPPLNELFEGSKKSERRTVILRAHVVHGYQLSEIARYLELHPTTISRIVNRTGSYN